MTSTVSWQSAFWCLPPLAMNTMMQPSGRVCSFHPSLRTYLRSSPIVCAIDTFLMLLRFALYICTGHAPSIAAKRVMTIRKQHVEVQESGGLQDLEQKTFFRCLFFLFGVVSQTIKLMACSGIPWTQTWGCLYLGSFLAVEAMNAVAILAEGDIHMPEDDKLEKWLAILDRIFGGAAIVLQLAILTLVDLAGIPPDPIPWRRWKFRGLRLSAHFVPVFIYLPFILSKSDDPVRLLKRQIKSLVLSMLLVNVVMTTLQTLNYRFSHMYFLWSVVISTIAWLCFFIPSTKWHILLVGPGTSGYMNVLVFDFFCRILCFSVFWYVWYYDPTGTFKPSWTSNLG